MRYASWPRRAASYLIDYAILVPLPVIANFMSSGRVIAILWAVNLLILVCNRWLLAGYNGRTLGRTAMRIRLVAERSPHKPIGFVAAFLRDVYHVLDSLALMLGWIRPLWRKTRQTIADSLVQSIVVPE
jgi:uncharacterized RDD family membrane protein YckC